jgi:hypothetical protein
MVHGPLASVMFYASQHCVAHATSLLTSTPVYALQEGGPLPPRHLQQQGGQPPVHSLVSGAQLGSLVMLGTMAGLMLSACGQRGTRPQHMAHWCC